ncbi:LPS translocon maturation chaperone LptM [Ferrimonas balearica]|uniref:LPS translocon maturation chaperone LptM n=1 Tax=Ferrimonas balearica TaxID=44012 RepID=UPI001C99FC96|nr:lipoprotein [Ferrimonas balearica]MBY5993343.1 lipoprotein [Ferrimonas balearica]
MQRIGIMLLLLLGLAACGQKGPLYLPDEPQSNQSEPQAAPQSAPQNNDHTEGH